MSGPPMREIWRQCLSLLLFLLSLDHLVSAQCAPYPIAQDIRNVTLSNGQTSRGVALSVGRPAQEFAFLPQWPLNNVIVYGINGYCTEVAPDEENACTTWRGGQYNELASDTRRVANEDAFSQDSNRYPEVDRFSDQMTLNDNVTLDAFPIGVPLEDWSQQGYHPLMAIGMGANSTILNALTSGGQIISRTWSMFYGWTGDSSNRQADGTFVLGGYDRAKVRGQPYSMPMSDAEVCDTDMVVTIDDIILNFRNGSTASLFNSGTDSFSACIIPDFPVLMTIPLGPFREFQDLTQTTITARSFGQAYFTMLYSDGDDPYDGDMTISLQDGPSIRIPNHQLVVPERYIDDDTGELVANSSARNLVLNSLQDVNANDIPQLGRQFLSSAYVMANQDTRMFTLWSSNPTNDVDLVAIDEDGNEVTEFCTPTESSLPSSRTSASSRPSGPADRGDDSDGDETSSDSISVGAIAGIAVGGAAGIAVIGLVTFLILRRRRRTSKPDVHAQPPTEEYTDNHNRNTWFTANSTPALSELPHKTYAPNGYMGAELPIPHASHPNYVNSRHELP